MPAVPGCEQHCRMIEIHELTKTYGSTTVVDAVSFTVQPRRVTGFLGPNGAGKTTVMRLLCGLATATSGTALVNGAPYTQLPNPARVVGVLLDASAQHRDRTGRETLALTALLVGVDSSRVDALLHLVGLSAAEARRRVGDYSLGMRQRLGLANALVGRPSVLILDEPANGLDPAGIRWMRELLRDFAERGGAVLLSSHLLSEIDALADDLVIIDHGRVVAAGSRDQLIAEADAAGADIPRGSSALEHLFLTLTDGRDRAGVTR